MSVIAYNFWSPTCGPCKNIKPALEQMKRTFLLSVGSQSTSKTTPQVWQGHWASRRFRRLWWRRTARRLAATRARM